MLEKILAFLEERIANGDIYVWGGSGQTQITEAWIRMKESKNQNGANADRAIATWKKRLAAGFKNIRAYDCSGLVSAALMLIGILAGRRDCDGLWARCERLTTPQNGALLFRVNKSNSEDETHVGFYFNGMQYHAKGRDDGVCKEPYNPDYWHKIGWFKGLPKEAQTSQPPKYVLTLGSLKVRRGNGTMFNSLGVVKKGTRLEYLGTETQEPKWYRVTYNGGVAWITSRPQYTRLVIA